MIKIKEIINMIDMEYTCEVIDKGKVIDIVSSTLSDNAKPFPIANYCVFLLEPNGVLGECECIAPIQLVEKPMEIDDVLVDDHLGLPCFEVLPDNPKVAYELKDTCLVLWLNQQKRPTRKYTCGNIIFYCFHDELVAILSKNITFA